VTVGVLIIDIMIQSSTSLKEKRHVLNKIRDRLRNKFNVSVAELDYLDKWQRSQVGIALISNEYSHAENSLQKIFRYLDEFDEFEITNYTFDYV
jgi:uncharacterized protein YlxP (DUF503 family)